MALGSAQVIGQRTSRIALTGAAPSARDQREIALMGREKSEAALASAQAAGMPLLKLGQQFAMLGFKQMLLVSSALMSIAMSRTPAESAGRQLKLVRDTVDSSAMAAARLSGSTARIARSALKPVHARVTGNLQRLRKS